MESGVTEECKDEEKIEDFTEEQENDVGWRSNSEETVDTLVVLGAAMGESDKRMKWLYGSFVTAPQTLLVKLYLNTYLPMVILYKNPPSPHLWWNSDPNQPYEAACTGRRSATLGCEWEIYWGEGHVPPGQRQWLLQLHGVQGGQHVADLNQPGGQPRDQEAQLLQECGKRVQIPQSYEQLRFIAMKR